ncbi:MAG: hypothetical protein R2843_15700 [Thermomicrobiales bacterium]
MIESESRGTQPGVFPLPAQPMPPRPVDSGNRTLAGVLGLVVITFVASLVLFGGGVIIGQDSATQFYPWYSYLGSAFIRRSGLEPLPVRRSPSAIPNRGGCTSRPWCFRLSVAIRADLHPFPSMLAGAGTYILSRLLELAPVALFVAAAAYELTSPVYGRSVCCPC